MRGTQGTSPRFGGLLVAPAVSIVRAAGADPGPLLARAKLGKSAENDTVTFMPLAAYRRFLDDAAEAARDPLLGVHAAAKVPRGAFGLIEYLTRSAVTLRDSLEIVIRFSVLYNDLYEFELREEGEAAVFGHRIPSEPDLLGRHANEGSIAITLATIRQGLPDFEPTRIRFAHEAHEAKAALRSALCVPKIEFGASRNEISFARGVLDSKLAFGDRVLFDLLTTFGEEKAIALRREVPILARAKQAIRDQMPKGPPTLLATSKILGTSTRLLQRSLAAESATFQSLYDEVRGDLARVYLRRSEPSIYEVALLLHYSEVSAFTRAFRRWTGMTPGEFRGARDT